MLLVGSAAEKHGPYSFADFGVFRMPKGLRTMKSCPMRALRAGDGGELAPGVDDDAGVLIVLQGGRG